jgi:hypothetical protein
MTAGDFRRIALSFDGAEEGAHMGAVDFRVGGRIFATLASVRDGFGNLMLRTGAKGLKPAGPPEEFVSQASRLWAIIPMRFESTDLLATIRTPRNPKGTDR